MKPKQFDLMLGVFLTLSAAVLSSPLKKWRVSEWRQKQQPNVWDLLSPPPSSASCACNLLHRSSGGNVAEKASRKRHMHGENNSRNHCPWLTLLSVLGTPPTHFLASKSDEGPLGELKPGNSASRTCSYTQKTVQIGVGKWHRPY